MKLNLEFIYIKFISLFLFILSIQFLRNVEQTTLLSSLILKWKILVFRLKVDSDIMKIEASVHINVSFIVCGRLWGQTVVWGKNCLIKITASSIWLFTLGKTWRQSSFSWPGRLSAAAAVVASCATHWPCPFCVCSRPRRRLLFLLSTGQFSFSFCFFVEQKGGLCLVVSVGPLLSV